MLRLVNSFTEPLGNNSSITALHFSPSNEINQTNILEYERESFQPILKEAQKLNLKINTVFKPSQDIYKEIVQTANNGNFDIMIIGTGKSVFEGSFLGKFMGLFSKIMNPMKLLNILKGKEKLLENEVFDDNVRQIIKSSTIPVGIFIDKGLAKIQNVFIPLYFNTDSFLLVYARRLMQNCGTNIVLSQFNGTIKDNSELKNQISLVINAMPDKITMLSGKNIGKEFIAGNDLILISHDGWRKAVKAKSSWLKHTNSVLIIKP
jgi:hypothetical protein